MKIKIKKKDQRYKKLLKVGDIVDLPNRVADRIITKGCGELVVEKPKKIKKKAKKKVYEDNIIEEKEPASEKIQDW